MKYYEISKHRSVGCLLIVKRFSHFLIALVINKLLQIFTS